MRKRHKTLKISGKKSGVGPHVFFRKFTMASCRNPSITLSELGCTQRLANRDSFLKRQTVMPPDTSITAPLM